MYTLLRMIAMPLTLTSREMNQDLGKAKKAAVRGPVIITDRGRPSHVLMSYSQYEKLTNREQSIADALGMLGGEEIEFDPPRSRELPRAADFS